MPQASKREREREERELQALNLANKYVLKS